MGKKSDTGYMKKAINLAKKAKKKGEVPVGAVIIMGNRIIAKGYNTRETTKNAVAHAEIIAIKKACRRIGAWRLSECEMFVTLEPCPMCAGAIINSRLKRIVFGAYDKKAGACGSVCNLFTMPFNHQPIFRGGVLDDRSAKLLSDFFKKLRKRKKQTEVNI